MRPMSPIAPPHVLVAVDHSYESTKVANVSGGAELCNRVKVFPQRSLTLRAQPKPHILDLFDA